MSEHWIIDNNDAHDVRNSDDFLWIRSDNDHGAFRVHDRISDDVYALNNIFLAGGNGVYVLNNTFLVDGIDVCYSCIVDYGVERYNHDDDDRHSRLDNQAQYLFWHQP